MSESKIKVDRALLMQQLALTGENRALILALMMVLRVQPDELRRAWAALKAEVAARPRPGFKIIGDLEEASLGALEQYLTAHPVPAAPSPAAVFEANFERVAAAIFSRIVSGQPLPTTPDDTRALLREVLDASAPPSVTDAVTGPRG